LKDVEVAMLRMWYELADLPKGMAADAREWEGAIVVRIARACTPEQLVPALNAIAKEILRGGQWFQIWNGKVVSMKTGPGGDDGGVHRGSLV
jgi:hypothetical protein